MSIYPYVVSAWMVAIGAYGIARSQDLIHLILCLAVVQSATYVLLIGVGYRTGAKAPVFADISPRTPVVDPVVQSLVLTDVVVEATVVALLLALVIQANKRYRTVDPDRVTRLHD